MAGESLVDEAYYVAKIVSNNGCLTMNNNKWIKHGEERDMKRKKRLESEATLSGRVLHYPSNSYL